MWKFLEAKEYRYCSRKETTCGNILQPEPRLYIQLALFVVITTMTSIRVIAVITVLTVKTFKTTVILFHVA